MPLTVGSLFSGIGGFDLGFERAGLEIKWQVESNPFCLRVLEKHWPQVKRYNDIKTVGAELEAVDVIVGGFPCQDIASNGTKVGITGPKSGLWIELVRVVGAIRPRYIVVENVADLLVRGMGDVLGALAALGYDAEWDCLPAASFGLPQRRWRVFIIAYARGIGCEISNKRITGGSLPRGWINPHGLDQAQYAASEAARRVCGMDAGISGTMDRVTALGNSVPPIMAQWIAERIAAAEAEPSGL